MNYKERQDRIEELIPEIQPKLVEGMSFNGSLRLDTDILPSTGLEPTAPGEYSDYWTMVWLSRIVAGIIVDQESTRAHEDGVD